MSLCAVKPGMDGSVVWKLNFDHVLIIIINKIRNSLIFCFILAIIVFIMQITFGNT